MSRATAKNDGEADERQEKAAEHVAGEHRRAPDRHRLEARDDALGHVLGNGDGGDLGGARER